jgi:hypothetical protein
MWVEKLFPKCLSLSRRCRYFLVALMTCVGTMADSDRIPSDLRIDKLKTFFASYGCPTPHHALDYVQAADAFQVDYRLLPAISLLESTCGTNGRLNNYWGWNSAHSAFDSVPAGIAFVTSQLAAGHPYRNKTLEQKLFTYNPVGAYGRKVKHLMTEIEKEPSVPAEPAPTSDLAPAPD